MSVYYFFDESDPVPFKYLTPTIQIGPLPLPYVSEMTPADYLEFAIADLTEGSQRGSVNAFGNAKRALHLTIDGLLHQYGLLTHFRRASFPQKLRLVSDVGMIPTDIIRNLNLERNEVEHDYSVPAHQRAQEAVDVAKLLVLATEKLLEATPHEAAVGWREPAGHFLLRIEPHAGELRFYRTAAPGRYKRMHGMSCLAGVRMPISGQLADRVQVAQSPWKVIPLNGAYLGEWLPIVRVLANIQRRQRTRGALVDQQNGTCSVYVTLPISLPDGISLNNLLEDAFNDRLKEDVDPEPESVDSDSG